MNETFNYSDNVSEILNESEISVVDDLIVEKNSTSFENGGFIFDIFSFVEGVEYSLNFFEILLGVFSGEGIMYSADLFIDELSSPSADFEGVEYSGVVGGYGVLADVVIDGSEASYCGDGVCDDDENCSSCPEDCGECSSGGSRRYVDVSDELDENESTEELDNESLFESEAYFVEKLLINVILEKEFLKDSRDLVLVLSSSGAEQTVNLDFSIYGYENNHVYERADELVFGNSVFRYEFYDLVLEPGEYYFVLEFFYNDGSRDLYRGKFFVDEESFLNKNLIWILFILVLFVVLFFIFYLRVIKKKKKQKFYRRVYRRDFEKIRGINIKK